MIWQGERNADGRLAWMYWPVVGTLVAGLLHAANAAVSVGLGFSMEYHRELARLERGDTFIWIGTVGKFSQPWKRLRERGVRRVYYQTEPFDLRRRWERCPFRNDSVDELFDFSWSNLERCSLVGPWAPRLRFVPPGDLGRRDPPRRAPTLKSKTMVFFGTLKDPYSRERLRTYKALKRALGDRLQHTCKLTRHGPFPPKLPSVIVSVCLPVADEAWNDTAFAMLLQTHDIFVNLHKDKTAAKPVTFRNALLLSENKLVISERAHARDEAEYDGMVIFSNDIIHDYHRLADDARVATRTMQLSSTRFRARFAPAELFRRAGVYQDWALRELA
jgi:hypothetical protein